MSDASLTAAAIAHSFDWVAVGHALALPADACRARFAALQASALSSDDGDIDLADLLGDESPPAAAAPAPRPRAPVTTTSVPAPTPPSSSTPASTTLADVFDFDAESELRVADAELSARLDAALSAASMAESAVGGRGGGGRGEGGGSAHGGNVWDRVLTALGGPLDAAAAARITIPAAMPRSAPYAGPPLREPRERPISREITESDVAGESAGGGDDGELDADAEREIARVTSDFYDSTRGGGGGRAHAGAGSSGGNRGGGAGKGGDLTRFFPQPRVADAAVAAAADGDGDSGPSFSGFDFSRGADDGRNESAWDALLADVELPERSGDVRSDSELSRVLLELGAASAAAMTDAHAKTGAPWETSFSSGSASSGVAGGSLASSGNARDEGHGDDNDTTTPSSAARGAALETLREAVYEGGDSAAGSSSALRGRGRAAAGRFVTDDDDVDDALDAASLRASLKARAAHAVATAPPATLAAAQAAATSVTVPPMEATEATLLMRLWREQRTAAGTRAIPLQVDDDDAEDGDDQESDRDEEERGGGPGAEPAAARSDESEGDETALPSAREKGGDAEGAFEGDAAGGAGGFPQGDAGDVLDYTDTPNIGDMPLRGTSDESAPRAPQDVGRGAGGRSKPHLSVAERYGLEEDEGFSTRILKSQQRGPPPRPTAAAVLEGTAATLGDALKAAWLSRPEALVQPY